MSQNEIGLSRLNRFGFCSKKIDLCKVFGFIIAGFLPSTLGL